jgi:hypothetical protein
MKPELMRGVYIGENKALKGQTAMLLITDTEVKAQFDVVWTGYAYGWHVFPAESFEITEYRP